MAEYLGLAPIVMRVAFVVAALAGGPGLFAYIVLAFIVPNAPALPSADRQSLPPPRA